MLSTTSKLGNSSGGGSNSTSEPLTRLACIRQCQETVQELVTKPMEISIWLYQLTRPTTHFPNPNHQQQQAQNIIDKRVRFETLLNDITTQINSLRYLFVRLREIHEYVLSRESNGITTNTNELSRLLKQKSIYEEILQEKQNQLKIVIDTVRDITYQVNTMTDVRQDGTINTLMNNTNTQEK